MAAAGRTPPRLIEVVHAETLGRHLRRVVFSGPELLGLPRQPGAHIKVFFPRPHQTRPVLPELGPNGPIWPPPDVRPIVRTYTLRSYDPARNELAIEFVLHAHAGPASRWAAGAQPGDVLGLAGPGGPHPLVPPAAFHGFVGDLSALPAIHAALEELPSHARGHVLCEVPDAADIRELRRPAGVEVQWLVRAPQRPSPLLEAAARLPWSNAGTYAFLAGEHSAVVAVRDHLRTRHGLDRRSMYATPYWKAAADEETYHQERHRVMDELQET